MPYYATRTIGVFAMMLLYAAAKVILYKSHVELFVLDTIWDLGCFWEKTGKTVSFCFKAALFGLEWAKTHSEFWVALI